MITAAELRIGNILDAEVILSNLSCERMIGIVGVSKDYVHAIDYDCALLHELSFDKLLSIPLTEEILIKAGFEKGYDDYFHEQPVYRINGMHIYCHVNSKELWRFSLYRYNDIKVCIEYLHQLQNLHYILTGKELEIKL